MVQSGKDSAQGGHIKIGGTDIPGNRVEVGGIGAVEVAVAAGTLGPFVTAFCAELGKRLGGTVADWASRVHLLRREVDSSKADLLVKVDDGMTIVELEEELSDEARLALLDLVVRAHVQGRRPGPRLRWDTATETWVPVRAC